MKRFTLFLSALLLLGVTGQAETTNNLEDSSTANTYVKGYNGNAFIFVEDGIEFSIFPDGQFDFYMQNYGPNVNAGNQSSNVSISYNKGYDYSAYVQYDDYGAIIQIESVPIYYDYYGRISQAGDVRINYNNYGRISRVGGLYIHYNRYNRYSHSSGYINSWNRHYVYRPWHQYYILPSINFCIVFNRPYRQHYRPVRYAYTQPYYNNYRRNTAVYSRRGSTVKPSRSYATVRDNKAPRRGTRDLAANTPRSNNGTVSPRSTSPRPRTSGNTVNTPRPRTNNGVTPRTKSPRTKGNTVNTPRPRTNSSVKPRTSSPRPRTVTPKSSTKPRTNSVKPRSSSPKPRVSAPRSSSPKPRVSTPRRSSPKRTVKKQTTRKPSTTSRSSSSKSKSSSSSRAR